MTSNSLDDLHPDLKPLAQKFLDKCHWNGLTVKITQTWRDPAYQNSLHASGVSPLTGDHSKHCFCVSGKPAAKAFDFAIFDIDGKYITDGADYRYAKAGQLAKDIGLIWGGNFKHPRPDPDHCEIS